MSSPHFSLPRFASHAGVVAAAALCLISCAAECQAQTDRQWAAARSLMVETDVAAAGIKQPALLAVMRSVPRHEFVPAEMRPYAYHDMALPIGEHQTISPPFIVAYMTAQLAVHPTDKVLEIGTGSGYQAAILGGMAKEVYTIEIVEPLAERAQKTFKRLKYKNIKLRLGDGYQGWPEHAPFDKIIVTCSPERVPQPLVEQLSEGGRIVIPLGERYQQTLFSLVRREGKLSVESREPTFFVPMTGQAESLRHDPSSGPLTPLANGDFEKLIDADKLAGWYYLRQARLEVSPERASGKQCLAFSNRVPGRGSQALQAIGVDGRRVTELEVDLWTQARDVRQGQTTDQQARLLVSYFDDDRVPVGQQAVGPWSGSFDWTQQRGRIEVPREARVAIVAIGLLGATGDLACDEIAIRAADSRAARR